MSNYVSLFSTSTLDTLDSLGVQGTVDFTDATLIGFPTDQITIQVNVDGVIEVMNGSITIAKVTGTDLWARILAIETVNAIEDGAILALQNKTQYQTASGTVTTFNSTIAVPVIILNGTDLNNRIGVLETKTTDISYTGLETIITNLQVSSLIVTYHLSVNGVDIPAALGLVEDKTAYQSASTVFPPITTFASEIVPSTNNAYDCGSAALAFKVIHTYQVQSPGALTCHAAHFYPHVTNTLNLGSPSLTWGTLYANALSLNGVDLNTRITTLETKTQYQTATGSITSWSSALNPTTTNTRDLGSLALEWRRLYAQELYVDGVNIISKDSGKLAIAQSVIPNATNTYDLGTSTYRWRTLTVQNITLNGFDLWPRITTLETKNQYQTSAAFSVKTDFASALTITGPSSTYAALSVSGGLLDGEGSAYSVNLLAPSNSGIFMRMSCNAGGYTELRHRNTGISYWLNSESVYQLSIRSTGFYITGGSYTEKPTGSTWSNPSDKRLKKNIRRDQLPGLAQINRLSLCSYEFNESSEFQDKEVHLGFIADEVAEIFPKACGEMDHKILGKVKSLDYHELFMALFPAVQELSSKLDAALNRIEYLEQQIGHEPNSKKLCV